MGKLAQIIPKDLVALLLKEGFILIRQTGSHLRLGHQDGRKTTIAIHSQPIPIGTLISIRRQIGMSKKTFEKMLQK